MEHLLLNLCDSAPEPFRAKSSIADKPLLGFDPHFAVLCPPFVSQDLVIVAGTLPRVDFGHMASELDPGSECFATVLTNARFPPWRGPSLGWPRIFGSTLLFA